MANFIVPGLSPDAAERQYSAWEKEAGTTLAHPTARRRLVRWIGRDAGQTLCIASVGDDIDCGPNPQGDAKLFVSDGATLAIIETETLAHIYSASRPVPVTIESGAIMGREYFDDFKPDSPSPLTAPPTGARFLSSQPHRSPPMPSKLIRRNVPATRTATPSSSLAPWFPIASPSYSPEGG